jgi:integrase
MASVFERNGKWYLRVRDATGKWVNVPSTTDKKTEARRLAHELEAKYERQRLGLEAKPAPDGGGTVGELLTWWLDTYSAGKPDHKRTASSVRRHFTNTELSRMLLRQVRPGHVETFLQEKGQTLAPQTVNHLRKFLVVAFNKARAAGRFEGANPVTEVARRKIPKRLPDYLRAEEVPRLLAALTPRWRPLFATAIFTGLRRGELLGLRKRDVDLGAGLVYVARSYDRDTTKGSHADAIPIAAELRPFLENAVAASSSELVFPGVGGMMMRTDVRLPSVLRRALGRAGIVTSGTWPPATFAPRWTGSASGWP